MSEALRTRCMDIIGKAFGAHVLRRYAGVAAHIRYLEEHPDDLGVPEHMRRGVNRGMGWSSDARKMGSMQYEQGAIDCLNFSAMYQLGYDKTPVPAGVFFRGGLGSLVGGGPACFRAMGC